jgi:hypothetical protein
VGIESLSHLSAAVMRRLLSAHKPFVRLARRVRRDQEQRGYRRQAEDVDRQIAQVATGDGPIVVGPWLAEVGYEVLYWIPFVRWFQDRFAIAPGRLTVVSRGGVREWYAGLASNYVDILDLVTPEALAERNARRRTEEEGKGSQKQSMLGQLDQELIDAVQARLGIAPPRVCHPSLMFRLFRNVWHHNLAMDVLWRRTRYATMQLPQGDLRAQLPAKYVTAKLYTGVAMPMSERNRQATRALITRAADTQPVLLLDADVPFDEHADFDLGSIPNVISARHMMTPATNLGVQSRLIAGSSLFIGTCGGLAWMAPFLGVPTVAVYDDDRLLDVHLMVARQAGRRAGAAEFRTLDLRAWREIGAVADT